MTTHKNIYIALSAAQSEMGPVVKGATNPHFRSKYADLSDVMSVALPALNRHGIAAWHSVVSADGMQSMRTTLSHGESDTHISCDVPLIVGKNDMQGMKSATTYAKRIGIESLTGIAPEDDDGNAAAKGAPVVDEMAAFRKALDDAKRAIARETTMDGLVALWQSFDPAVKADGGVIKCKDARKAELAPKPSADIGDDEIPY